MTLKRLAPTAVLAALAACARVVAPSGGPEDTEGPQVVAVLPEPGRCQELPEEIVIEFSEKLAQDESAVQLYPNAGTVHISGDRIRITPESASGVVAVTVSGGIGDRRGNTSGEPVTFVWNTLGPENFGWLEISVSRSGGGAVTETSRCDLFLLPDTARPLTTVFPDSMNTMTAGWLPPGEYLFHCYEDNDRSFSWDMEREAGALETLTLTSGDTLMTSLSMSITDSIGPAIASITALDGWHLEILWNEQVSQQGAGDSTVTVMGPDGAQLEVYGFMASAGRSSTGRTTVYTARMSDTLYTVSVQGVTDLAGNPSLPDTLEVWSTDSLPASGLSIQSAYPQDGGLDIPPAGPFTIQFSDWVFLEDLKPLYRVTLVSDSSLVPGTLERLSPITFSFQPDMELLGERQYRIDLDSGLVSLQGDTLPGRSWTFVPAWSLSPGSISGVISGTGAAEVKVVVASAGGDAGSVTGTFGPGEYLMDDLSGGRYTAACFVDWNGNDVWDPGEPYGAWPGVVDVYPGIDTPNIDIQVVP